MRISDWSSDVCSSDLGRDTGGGWPSGGRTVVQRKDKFLVADAGILQQLDQHGEAGRLALLAVGMLLLLRQQGAIQRLDLVQRRRRRKPPVRVIAGDLAGGLIARVYMVEGQGKGSKAARGRGY